VIRDKYYFETDDNKINTFLEAFKTPKDITGSNLNKYFSQKSTINYDKGKVEYTPPLYYSADEFLLKKDTLPNVKKDIQTSYGLYIFNLFVIVAAFNDIIDYINEPMTKKRLSNLLQQISDYFIQDKITGEQFTVFQTNLYFLAYKSTIFTVGASPNMVKPNKNVMIMKEKLIKENKDIIDRQDHIGYINKIEKPLMEYAVQQIKNDPSYIIYLSGYKPDFKNVYKECNINMGASYNPTTQKYQIITSSLNEGIPNEDLAKEASIIISGFYSRNVATQEGGGKTKLLFSAMQNAILDNKGTDCKTTFTLKVLITPENKKKYLYRYIVDKANKQYIRLNYENIDYYMGKTVEMRSVVFCQTPHYCNICAGDYLYELGIKNIGLVTGRISGVFMGKALKSFHDASLDTIRVDPFKYMTTI
jgi:hypothetical protein